MKFPTYSLKLSTASTLLIGATLTGCGGGSTPEQSATLSSTSEQSKALPASTYIPQSRGSVTPTNTTNSSTSGVVTDMRFESTSATAQTNVPVTFGQIFAPGHLLKTTSLVGRLDSGATVPLQLDVKALHADGSVRHAIISAILPALGANEIRTMTLNRSVTASSTTATVAPLLASGFRASFNATIGGVRYTASADDLLKASAKAWLNGATASEWHVSAPLKTSAGVAHPHLTARFAVRSYDTLKKARVDVTIENNWAYEAGPQNFTYDAEIVVGDKIAYSKSAMEHFHHARWRKVFWWNGAAPEINVKHNTGYLIASRALPNYDQSLSIPESSLKELQTRWTGPAIEPMGTGLSIAYMPATGGRDDIGILPGWATIHLLSMDRRARDVTFGTAEQAGSYSAHYRDKNTDQPVSLIDFPYMTMVGTPGDTYNPVTKRAEQFPGCATSTACKSPYTYDISHQPGFAYLPYMLTGDHFFLEELQFWGMYNVFNSNPGYRDNIKGLLRPEQVRGQAWALRTLAEVSYITPDSDRLKEHFNRILDSNLDWYNENYTNSATANKLGVIVNGYAVVYSGNRGVAPWQDDFFTAAVGHAHDLGFAKASSLLKYKATFPIQRMVGEGACYVRGAMYSMMVRDSENSPYYATIGQAFKASDASELGAAFSTLECGSPAMGTALGVQAGEMTGYSTAYAGYPSNMQPALAYGADIGGTDGAKAWSIFMARTVKPDYRPGPQFAIVPR